MKLNDDDDNDDVLVDFCLSRICLFRKIGRIYHLF